MKKLYFLVLAICFFTASNAQIINFPDPVFKAKLLDANMNNGIAYMGVLPTKVDRNNDGEIDISEAQYINRLEIPNHFITDLTGIEYFTNLRTLNCARNLITVLDVSDITALKKLSCEYNQLTSLDVSHNTALTDLSCGGNLLTSLDVSNNMALTDLSCGGEQLTTLDLSHNTALSRLICERSPLISFLDVSNNVELRLLSVDSNNITAIDLSHNTLLVQLNCKNNLLTTLDLHNNPGLQLLSCDNNNLTELDLSHNPNLTGINCTQNPIQSLDLSYNTSLMGLTCGSEALEYINLKNGKTIMIFNLVNTPNLKYICIDEERQAAIQTYVTSQGYTNCLINSYCSFKPGGKYYTVYGGVKHDYDNNGCDDLDVNVAGMRFLITSGTGSEIIIANATGNYSLYVNSGAYTIKPIPEFSDYFNVEPPIVEVDFPSQTSPLEQNFCMSSNGLHPDLEVVLIPMFAARPGFDTYYKLIYKNKGNKTQSGIVNFVFNDAILDFVVANPIVTTQTTNNLSWSFTNLRANETREIGIVLNLNSPVEIPAVNAGDVISYTATINDPANQDDTPNDNVFTLNQEVVNSFDPNDKTCLEGSVIPPNKVGDYVHYTIRFENTGTYPAQNIVVKDMIDLAKFDISTLVPIKGSHPFVTKISNTNKVEFIFENINLPFDDANNDGYITFKIKTKPTLVLGNSFSNTASIYFDYNHPIITNTATTMIQALNTKDFEFSNYFSLYPNPVKDNLSIVAKSDIQISSISIYNALGQQVLVVTNAQNTKAVDVSNLPSGNYFVKINSNKGSSNTKFIKS